MMLLLGSVPSAIRVFSKVEHLRRHERSREYLSVPVFAGQRVEHGSWKIPANGHLNARPAADHTPEGVCLLNPRLRALP